MDDYKMEELHMDRLSELPQSLIFHILSFLPIRDVVSTSLLSKRWENLWTTIPCLNFSHILELFGEPDSDFIRNFVNRALLSWNGAKLLKLVIDIGFHFDKSLGSDMNLWVRLAVENKVEELKIHLMYSDETSMEEEYWAPRCLNSCSSLRKLSLCGCNLRIPGSPTWNRLTSLRIGGVCFGEDLINRILLGTPQLEEFDLTLLESNENLSIQSTSLKKLKIQKSTYVSDNQLTFDTVLRICCPNLETLEIFGLPCGKCLLTNVSLLTDAALYFLRLGQLDAREIEFLGETMRHLFSTFKNVERLKLSSSSFQVLKELLKKNSLSPLPNVGVLEVHSSIELVEMVHLLRVFPNLKILVIESVVFRTSPEVNAENFSEFETNLSKSFVLQLKIIKITSNFYASSIFRCAEFLLKHCGMLEKLVVQTICLTSDEQEHLLEVEERLLSMPRSSPNAKNLKMLVIEDHTSQCCQGISTELGLELSTSSVLQLKNIKIITKFADYSMFQCVEFFLKHCSMLEKLVIWPTIEFSSHTYRCTCVGSCREIAEHAEILPNCKDHSQ